MCVDTSTTNDSGKYGRRCHFLLLARTALEVGVDNRVTDGRARSLELNARGVHVPDVIAVSPDGGGCRRCSKDSGAGNLGGIGSGGVAASIVGGHAELQNIMDTRWSVVLIFVLLCLDCDRKSATKKIRISHADTVIRFSHSCRTYLGTY